MNSISEGFERELPPDVQGEIKRGPTTALGDLKAEIDRASEPGITSVGKLEKSSIESRTDLRLAAVNEAMRADPTRNNPLKMDTITAVRWANLDSMDFGRIRSQDRRETALESIAAHARVSPEYAVALKDRSPSLSRSVNVLNEELSKLEQAQSQASLDATRKLDHDARAFARQTILDQAGLASLAVIRARETARVIDSLLASPSTSTQQLLDAKEFLKAPPLDGRVTGPNDPDLRVIAERALKRPIHDNELSASLKKTFIVTEEKRGFFKGGIAEFTYRDGQDSGKLAISDMGKTLTTTLEDKATIQAMVEIAALKKWETVTLNGSDDFKRSAWLEASLAGLQVRGYTPREADLIKLDELKAKDRPINSITDATREKTIDSSSNFASSREIPRKHIDTDALTSHEKTVLDASRAFLNTRDFGPDFNAATLRDLESRIRGERVFIGEVVDHGQAPYKFNKDNDNNYFVTLKTQSGEQVVWGKGLGEAMQDFSKGQQIVLQNIGKTSVTVTEKLRDAQGNVISVQPKAAQLNAWKGELLSRFSEKAKSQAIEGATRRPAMGVYDPKAPRQQTATQTKDPAKPQPQHTQQQSQPQRSDRNR